LKKDWTADPRALTSLVAWLDADDGDRADGAGYVAMHGRLASYFARKGCRTPDELADETLTRVARRLQEEGTIAGVAPAQFCYITARYVWLEHLRDPAHAPPPVTKDPATAAVSEDDEQERERWLACLDTCLAHLDPDDRQIILDYYAGASNERIARRRELVTRLGTTANALAIKASRLRERLRTCVAACATAR
jgi:DNA-directed RNA polymerase specialized sigma24 family protein